MRGKWRAQRADRGAHAARGFVGGAAGKKHKYKYDYAKFQCRTRLCGWCSADDIKGVFGYCIVSMPHAALWVVQPVGTGGIHMGIYGFNAARGFVGGAAMQIVNTTPHEINVSMPHAALWVVQRV